MSQVIPSEKLKMELCKKVSEIYGMKLADVERIINFQFSEVRAATTRHSCIEISGFAKLTINQTKIAEIEKKYGIKTEQINKELENPDLSERKRKKLNLDIKNMEEAMVYARTKVREALPPKAYKENNRIKKEWEERQKKQLHGEEEIEFI